MHACPHCNADLERDVKDVLRKAYEWPSGKLFGFDCPSCGTALTAQEVRIVTILEATRGNQHP